MPHHQLSARQLNARLGGDPFGVVVYRPTTPSGTFSDRDTGAVFSATDRARYRRSAGYRARRDEILRASGGCDVCGSWPQFVWGVDPSALGRETPSNTVVLCRPCNDRAFRARQSLGLAA